MWNWIKSLFSQAEQEFEHVMADIQALHDKLAALVTRKTALADEKTAEASAAQAAAAIAQGKAAQARAAQGKVADLLGLT